ncbi:hypothetical protein [Embleya sp. NBC_00896]|uniref:hypothetical protein n=1 Tax=Embleya sp. NBC_00896 TaxID=2975961 RepID=UPI00386E27F0|nr:hypothetical protein OG928_17565 [Embleya sp. NBC_00896]
MSRTEPISPASHSYGLRHGGSTIPGFIVATVVTVIGVATVPFADGWGVPLAIGVGAVGLVFVVLALVSSRRVVVRADATGLALRPAFQTARTVPWAHVNAVVVWSMDEQGRRGLRGLGVVADPEHRATITRPAGGFMNWSWAAYDAGAGATVSPFTTPWQGDVDDLRELVTVIRHFAPAARIVDHAHANPVGTDTLDDEDDD